MGKKQNLDKEHKIINTLDDYRALFEDKNKHILIKHILDIRKFEIELYWKRTTFFWTIIAAIMAGYFLVFSKNDASNINSLKTLFALGCLGLIFSVGWYFANRGSKFWQVNWEKHLDCLEDEVLGPLYKTTLNKEFYNKRFFSLNLPYPFSVSKINQVLNLVLIAFWLIILFDLNFNNLEFSIRSYIFFTSFYFIVGLFTFFSIISLYIFTQTGNDNILSKPTRKSTIITFEKRGLADDKI
jgi:hypothetical protein